MVLSRLAMFHVFANNSQTGKDASLTSLDFSASIFEGKDYLALRGLILDTIASTASRVGIAPGAGTTPPTVYANSIQTDMYLHLEAKGTGNIRFGAHAAAGAETVTGYIPVQYAPGTAPQPAVLTHEAPTP